MVQIEASEDARRLLVRARIDALVAQTKPARVSAIVAAAMLSILFVSTEGVGWTSTIIWLCAMVVAFAFRDWLVLRMLKHHPESKRGELGIALASAALAIVNYSPAAFFMPYMSPTISGMYVGFMVAWLALAVSVIGIHVPSYAAYVVIGMTYLSIGYWIQLPTSLAIAASLGALAACILLITFSRRVAAVFEDSVLIRHERDALVAQLTLSVSQAKDAQNQRSSFLAATAHDLLQPVHALMLLSGVLKDSRTDRERDEALGRVQSTTETIETMFRGLLDLARLDQGAVMPTLTDVRLAMVFRSIEAAYISRCDEKGIGLVVECDESILVRADATLLDRVVRNLVDNAVKFTTSGHVGLKAIICDKSVKIIVSDTGMGVADDQQAVIFDAFFRSSTTVHQGIQGIGLGLSVAKQMTELMEGKLELESDAKTGTEVSVTLGVGGDLMEGAEDSAVNPPSILPERIVVIEDDVAARGALNLWLQNNGIKTISAESLESGLRQMTEEGFIPQHALVDYHLGTELNGIQAIRKLREIYPAMKATLVSGAYRESELVDSDVVVLQKPLRPERLREVISIIKE